jgi:hypothetical protein
VEDLNLTRSNDPVELAALPITMTVADQDHVKGLFSILPHLKDLSLHVPRTHMGDNSLNSTIWLIIRMTPLVTFTLS